MGFYSFAEAGELKAPPQSRAMIISVASPLLPALSVRGVSAGPRLAPSPAIDTEQSNHAEMAGATLVGLAALWAARRRRLV